MCHDGKSYKWDFSCHALATAKPARVPLSLQEPQATTGRGLGAGDTTALSTRPGRRSGTAPSTRQVQMLSRLPLDLQFNQAGRELKAMATRP